MGRTPRGRKSRSGRMERELGVGELGSWGLNLELGRT